MLTTTFGKLWDSLTPDQQKQAGPRKTFVSQQVAANLPVLLSPGYQAILHSDPGPDWRAATVPVLGLYGGKDTQVPADQNAPALAAELGTQARALSTIVVLPDANHLFQSAKTGSPDEYGTLDQTFTPDFLPTLVDWVKARTSDVVPPSSGPTRRRFRRKRRRPASIGVRRRPGRRRRPLNWPHREPQPLASRGGNRPPGAHCRRSLAAYSTNSAIAGKAPSKSQVSAGQGLMRKISLWQAIAVRRAMPRRWSTRTTFGWHASLASSGVAEA